MPRKRVKKAEASADAGDVGERCMRDGILNTVYGREQADALRRQHAESAEQRQREYTENALRLERALEAFPGPPPRQTASPIEALVRKAVEAAVAVLAEKLAEKFAAMIDRAVALAKTEIVAEITNGMKGLNNGDIRRR